MIGPAGTQRIVTGFVSTPHIILTSLRSLLHPRFFALPTGFTANDEQQFDRNRHPDENFVSRDQVSLSTSADENSCRRGPSNQLQLPVAVECLSQGPTSTDPTRGFRFKFFMASADEVSPIRAKTEVNLTGSPCLRTNRPVEMNIRFRKPRQAYCG
jgi:hypothetical protein